MIEQGMRAARPIDEGIRTVSEGGRTFTVPDADRMDVKSMLGGLVADIDAALVGVSNGARSYPDPTYEARRPHMQTVRSVLAHYDWTYVGSGHFAMVIKSELYPGLVVKVGMRTDDAGAAYAMYCRDRNRHGLQVGLPDVMGVHKTSEVYYVVMPEYYPMPRDRFEFDPVVQEVQVAIHGAPVAQPVNPALIDTARDISIFFRGIADIDLHSDNVMQDMAGNIIITDPVSFKRGG